ncbi:ABC transporter permease [Cellulophaga baltica]|uniref:ABC transporter permease n=1 Tax=Cellulophaga TaxID=104264 RepID=UPI001C06E4A8|nr:MULTISPECIES: ABC transporter permease [Cellulophaga]MBU2995310.1 ABC transporter permease [Cellulophaga baltica]MDO6766705.1 ABC transporter permease [Cellulophaga sp. 1_MG-2023]
MNILKISMLNMKSKALYTFLSVVTLGLSIALLLGIKALTTSFEYQIENNLAGIDLVVGAKGSPLQLVLASVLHMDNPTGNINYNEAKKIAKNPLVKTAVPISYGDNYKGYKIVGTTDDFASLYNAKLATGATPNKSMQVVLGHTVAEQLHLKLGDHILSAHDLVEKSEEVHDEELEVVGIYAPTHTVIDRLITTKLESVWDLHHHEEEEHHEEEHDEHEEAHHETKHQHNEKKEITSLLLSFTSPIGLLTLPRRINEKTNMQAALPKYELDKLYQYTGVGLKTVLWIAYLILVISSLTLFVSFYKMVKERAFDLALLRTYGASNFQLVRMILYEGIIIGVLAYLTGFLISKIGVSVLLQSIQTNQIQNLAQGLPFMAYLQIAGLIFTVIILSILLAIYPIIKMNISTILSHEK